MPGRFLMILAAFTMVASTTAQAQDIPEGIGVADRSRPDYQPVGGRVGSFFIYPELDAILAADDNVFATNTDAESDVIVEVEPAVRIESIWSRHSLRGRAYYRHAEYLQNDQESTDEYGVDMSGRFDVDGTSSLRLRLGADHRAENRYSITSDTTSVTPVEYDELSATLGARKEFGRFTVDGALGVRSLTFEDNVSRAGAFLNGDKRDVTISSADLTLAYGGRAAVSTFVRGRVERRSYPFGPEDAIFDPASDFNRDSEGAKIEGGLSFRLQDRLYGNIRAGYISHDYEDPQLKDISGLSYGADLLWNPTRLTSVRIAVNRLVDNISSTRNAGNLRTRYSAAVSHELQRNIILSTEVDYSQIEPVGPGDESNELEAAGGVRYLINRRFAAELGLIHRSRSSDLPTLRFSSNRAVLRLLVTL